MGMSLALMSSMVGCGGSGASSLDLSDTDVGNVKVVAREGKGALLESDGQKILLLQGTPYEIGYQHGSLLKDDVKVMVETVIKRCEEEKSGFLQRAWDATNKYIPERYKEELKGLADGAGLSLKDVELANVFPELFHCSGIAVFGKATKDGELLHGRILDYTTDEGLQDHAVVMVVKPEGYNAFINAGFAGFIGSVTGMNQKGIAIGEMGGGGDEQWSGVPMAFLVRMVLEQANTLSQGVDVFRKNPRTCEYYYVISDGKLKDARALYCTPQIVFTLKPGQNHPKLPAPPLDDTLIISGNDRYLVLLDRIKENYGKIDVNRFIEIMKRPAAMEHNLHDAIFEPKKLTMWLAVAKDPQEENYQACYQKYYKYNLNGLMRLLNN